MCYILQCWNLCVRILDSGMSSLWNLTFKCYYYKILWLFKSLMVYVWLINEMHFSQGIYCILGLERATFLCRHFFDLCKYFPPMWQHLQLQITASSFKFFSTEDCCHFALWKWGLTAFVSLPLEDITVSMLYHRVLNIICKT